MLAAGTGSSNAAIIDLDKAIDARAAQLERSDIMQSSVVFALQPLARASFAASTEVNDRPACEL